MNKGGFSWKSLLEVYATKARISRSIGIPLTKDSRKRKRRKIGMIGGCLSSIAIGILLTVLLSVAIAQAQQAPPFTVAWKEGVILGLLVPPKTTKEQLKTLVYKLRQAKKDNNLASLLPPINLGLKDKYAGFILLFFSDQKWSTIEEYKKYERANERTANGRAISKAYLNQIVASYSYEFVNGKEYGAIGYNDGADKSAQFKKLF